MIRRKPPPEGDEGSSRYAFTGPPPASEEAVRWMGHRMCWVRNNFDGGNGVRGWAELLAKRDYPVDYNTISRYERAALQPPASYLWIVAKISRADPGWLLTGEGWQPTGYSKSWEPPSSVPRLKIVEKDEPPPEEPPPMHPRGKIRGPRKKK